LPIASYFSGIFRALKNGNYFLKKTQVINQRQAAAPCMAAPSTAAVAIAAPTKPEKKSPPKKKK